jgi:hypothetical protein
MMRMLQRICLRGKEVYKVCMLGCCGYRFIWRYVNVRISRTSQRTRPDFTKYMVGGAGYVPIARIIQADTSYEAKISLYFWCGVPVPRIVYTDTYRGQSNKNESEAKTFSYLKSNLQNC